MPVGPILTLGLGSYSTVNKLPTLGYGVSETPAPEPEPETPATPPPFSGGWLPPGRKRDIKRDRERFGIQSEEVVQEVAVRQARQPELDDQQRFEELARELELRGIEWEARYLELLNQQRVLEIERLRMMQRDEEDVLALLQMAADYLTDPL